MNGTIQIGRRLIGKNQPLYFVADIGANHDSSLEKAFHLIELAKEAKADAVKFQNFKAPKIVSQYGFDNLPPLAHQTNWKKSVYEIYEAASISDDWTPLLKEKCDALEIDYFTSPYDFESVDYADKFVDVFKIGSGDITWLEIIEHIAKKGKPVMIASGASTIKDVERAMKVLQKYTGEIVLMQCNTNYTVAVDKIKYVNLNVLKTFAERFPGVVLGLSDHTTGHATVLGAVALGAVVFEKHFTDNTENEGPDHKFAINPPAWREMVERANELYSALGDGIKRVEDNEKDSLIVQQRCLRAERNLEVGEILRQTNLEALRPLPPDGIQPFRMAEIVGKILIKPLEKGEHITEKHFS